MTPSALPPAAGDDAAPPDRAAIEPTTVDAREEDAPFLFELYCSTREDEVAAWNWPPGEVEPFLRMQHRAQRESYAQHYPDAANRIIVWRGRKVGRVLTARTADAIALIDLAIFTADRNRGLGTAIIRQLQELARSEGRGVRLHVLIYSPARTLYARLGFRENGGALPYVAMRWDPPRPASAPETGPGCANPGAEPSAEGRQH
jgi:GNAT superfamily N-acetyltransferase